MSCPLYKSFKEKGTSLYIFPSAAAHLSESFQNTSVDMNFTKFALLNIKSQNTNDDFNIFDFNDLISSTNDTNFYQNLLSVNSSYGDRLIESLRNYVANYDSTIKESKLNVNKDFYDINETQSPTEAIFWKWLRKMNVIDLEPAVHKIDWDKNLNDFDNINGSTISNIDYFRKYLWKERETIIYNGVLEEASGNKPMITINSNVKFRNNDIVTLNGDSLIILSSGVNYKIESVVSNETTSTIILSDVSYINSTPQNVTIKLNYNKLIQYIGEIDAISKVSTAKKNFTEVSAFIPSHCGKTPTILFKTDFNNNYYPNLELPLLPTEKQSEIIGAENLESPIRQSPYNYPGNYYAQYDNNQLTYKCTNGDEIRYLGDYFGILLNNNVGLNSENYFEKLNDFNSKNIDGLALDFDINHYYKMNQYKNTTIDNFDEFNGLSINGNPPEDFEYNAILWYYDYIVDNVTSTNLFGITFLNNPSNDDDTNNTNISTYQKLVSNGKQDGLSYQHSLNLSIDIDNDMLPAMYDPESIYNKFSFELYNNLMSYMAKLNESFENIINKFITMNEDMNSMQNLIYSQQDIDLLKNKMQNLEDLLLLYKNNQLVDSESTYILNDNSGAYPQISVNVKKLDYGNITNIKTSDIYNYIVSNNSSYMINIIDNNRILLNINNDDLIGFNDLDILIQTDLYYKQTLEVNINYNNALKSNKLNFKVNFKDINGFLNITDLYSIGTPVNLLNDDPIIYSKSNYINTSISKITQSVTSDPNNETLTIFTLSDNIFGETKGTSYVYIDNLLYLSGNTTIDYSGVYGIESTNYSSANFKISLNTVNLTLLGIPTIYIFKSIKLLITRIDKTYETDIKNRYIIEKRIL